MCTRLVQYVLLSSAIQGPVHVAMLSARKVYECVNIFNDGAESHLENTQATVHKDAVYS